MIRVAVGAQLTDRDPGLKALINESFAGRLFRKDASLWGPEPHAEAARRLGWIDALERGPAIIQAASEVREELTELGVDRIVLSGMGGSSLAPEVITRHHGVPLTILDSTHPEEVEAALAHLDRAALVVSSKSGSTIETRSHLAAFEAAYVGAGITPTDRIIIVTDPNSPLHVYAQAEGYRVFLADPEVGGRYSALTAFGLVPSVLAGVDATVLLEEAREAVLQLSTDDVQNPALQLAAALAAQLPQRFIFGVVETADFQAGLGDWIEQLVAESSGKRGRGMLPVTLTETAAELSGLFDADRLAQNMFFVTLNRESIASDSPDHVVEVSGPLGAQFLLWEVATAALCKLIGVNPFDQPDVESAKSAARAAFSAVMSEPADRDVSKTEGSPIELFQDETELPDYIAIQAYVSRNNSLMLERFRDQLISRYGVPVSLGYGPRYLHSTGQFHKGGPPTGAFVQVHDNELRSLDIPGQDGTFGQLLQSQARGDREVLSTLGRPVEIVDKRQLEL